MQQSPARFFPVISKFSTRGMTISLQFLPEEACSVGKPRAGTRSACCLRSASGRQPQGPVYIRLLSVSRTKWPMRSSLCTRENVMPKHHGRWSKVRRTKRSADLPGRSAAFNFQSSPSHRLAVHAVKDQPAPQATVAPTAASAVCGFSLEVAADPKRGEARGS